MKKALLAVTLLLFWASSAWGQKNGMNTFSASDNFEVDSINLTNLVPSINIPVVLKGVGPINGSLRLELNDYCTVNGTQWTCNGTSAYGPPGAQGAVFLPIVQEMIGMAPVYTSFTSGGCTRYTITGVTGADGLSFYPVASTTIFGPPTMCGAQTATGVKTTDGSGYTFSFAVGGGVVTFGSTSTSNASGWTVNSIGTTITDAFSNTLTDSLTSGNLTDALGAATSYTASPAEYNYTDTSGTTQHVTLTSGTSHTFVPLGGTNCGASGTNNNFTPITAIGYPDGTSYSFGWQTNGTGLSGLINSITLRTGGQISYSYTWNSSCTAGGWGFSSLTRTTPDGAWSYTTSTASQVTTTTVKDPGLNKTVYTFGGSGTIPTVINEVDRYQNTGSVASPSYTLISKTTYCYNSPCVTNPTYPITIRQTDEYLGTTHMSQRVEDYDSYGNVTSDAVTDEITSTTITTTYVYGTYSSGTCSAITNTEVNDHPCTITTKNGTTWLSGSTYTYNTNGALTSSSQCLSSTCTGSSALTTTYTPTTQGTYSAIQDPNGQTVNYTYGSCNSLMPTDVTTTVNSIAIDNKATWNCDAGVKTDVTDANSNEADFTYDSMNRLHTYHDYMGDTNTTTYDYGTPTLDHVKVTDNIGVVSYQYNDGLGRPSISQVYNGTNYDTVSHAYGWKDSGNNALTNFQTTTSGGTSSAACTATLGSACTTVTLTALTNPIAGPYKTTDANSGTGTYAVNSKDFSFTAGPAPSGENTKVLQTEVDGFGRLTSTCALTSTGYDGRVACGQTMGNNGTLTSNTYSFPSAGVSEVQTTRGLQTHTSKADAVGRTTSYQNPEAGTTTGSWDSIAANFCFTGSAASSSSGDLVGTTDAASNKICMYYDGLHRLTDVGNSNQSNTNPAKRYRYDSTANNYATKPTGYPATGNNLVGRLMEAETDYNAVTLTDEWFAYDKMGRVTDMWESTPNSGGFYHITVTYDNDGAITGLSGIPSYSSITYTLDGEERWNSMKYGTTTIVNSTGFTFDAAGAPTNVPISTGSDKDVYTWDQLENMKTYTFDVGTKADGGTLTWNSIGSLGKLVISDTITSSTDSETCAYTYDDVARLLSEATVTGSTCNGPMTYTYDQYDNLTQAGTYSWNPGYNGTSSNNQQTGSTYDSDGNVKTDGVNSYTWNIYGKIASARSGNSAAVCGTSGICYTYDALGNFVEWQFNGGTSQYVYSPLGMIAKMNGQTTTWAFVPAPGGGHLWQSGTTSYFVHTDWLGTERMVDTIGGTNYNAQAYTAYGQQYDILGSGFQFFTGLLQDESGANLYLTPNRNLFQNSGRWLSPDPAHSGWNAYAYVTDPNTQTDPSGLAPQEPSVIAQEGGLMFCGPGQMGTDTGCKGIVNSYLIEGSDDVIPTVVPRPDSGPDPSGPNSNDLSIKPSFDTFSPDSWFGHGEIGNALNNGRRWAQTMGSAYAVSSVNYWLRNSLRNAWLNQAATRAGRMWQSLQKFDAAHGTDYADQFYNAHGVDVNAYLTGSGKLSYFLDSAWGFAQNQSLFMLTAGVGSTAAGPGKDTTFDIQRPKVGPPYIVPPDYGNTFKPLPSDYKQLQQFINQAPWQY